MSPTRTNAATARSAQQKTARSRGAGLPASALRCRRKFLRFFKKGFYDETYVDWERGYKWKAHQQWNEVLAPDKWKALLRAGRHEEVAAHAVRIESRTNLLFSFEKMALRDAVRSPGGAKRFASELYELCYGEGDEEQKFERWCEAVAVLPRKQTRVLTWPIVTVFGFLALPERHIFLKPNVTKLAAREYGFDFTYQSRPAWVTYDSLLGFARTLKRDLRDLRPRDMIDIQSFVWVQGSDEYDE